MISRKLEEQAKLEFGALEPTKKGDVHKEVMDLTVQRLKVSPKKGQTFPGIELPDMSLTDIDAVALMPLLRFVPYLDLRNNSLGAKGCEALAAVFTRPQHASHQWAYAVHWVENGRLERAFDKREIGSPNTLMEQTEGVFGHAGLLPTDPA